MRNLTGSQCNRFRIGTEQLNRGAFVTTLAIQFWTHCNNIAMRRQKIGVFIIVTIIASQRLSLLHKCQQTHDADPMLG